MKIVTKEISGIASALYDMRKPLASYDKGDSVFIKNSKTGYLELESIGEKDEVLFKKLGRTKAGSGHDCVLKDIVVHLDITATHDFFLQLYRYHFRDTASSTSKMHCITKGAIEDFCSEYVHIQTMDLVNDLISLYNEDGIDVKEAFNKEDWLYLGIRKTPTNKKELFECIIHNTPIGYQLTVGEVTNYLQLKSMYQQRKNHKMSMWNTVFVEWVKTLPMSYLITGEDE